MTSTSDSGAFTPAAREGEETPVVLSESTIPGAAASLTWTVTTQQVVALIGRKWVIPVLRELASGTKRHFQMQYAIKGVTAKVLTDTLRFLERDGVVERVLHDEGRGSKSVAYRLTDMGRSLAEPLTALYRWGREHLEEVHQVQADTDARWTSAEDHPSTRAPAEEPKNPLK